MRKYHFKVKRKEEVKENVGGGEQEGIRESTRVEDEVPFFCSSVLRGTVSTSAKKIFLNFFVHVSPYIYKLTYTEERKGEMAEEEGVRC